MKKGIINDAFSCQILTVKKKHAVAKWRRNDNVKHDYLNLMKKHHTKKETLFGHPSL